MKTDGIKLKKGEIYNSFFKVAFSKEVTVTELRHLFYDVMYEYVTDTTLVFNTTSIQICIEDVFRDITYHQHFEKNDKVDSFERYLFNKVYNANLSELKLYSFRFYKHLQKRIAYLQKVRNDKSKQRR